MKRDLEVEKGAISAEKSNIVNGPSLRDEKPKWISHNLGNLLRETGVNIILA